VRGKGFKQVEIGQNVALKSETARFSYCCFDMAPNIRHGD